MSDDVEVSPHDPQAERTVLYHALCNDSTYDELSGVLTHTDFYVFPHREIYRIGSTLVAAGKPADAFSILDFAKREGLEADISPPFLASIRDAWTSHNPMSAAKVVRGNSLRRQLNEVGRRIVKDSFDISTDAESLLDRAESLILDISQLGAASDTVDVMQGGREAAEKLEQRIARYKRGEFSGVLTGLPKLDRVTLGFQPGQLIVVGARPSVGKTTFGLLTAIKACTDGVPVYFDSLEQTRADLLLRIWCTVGKVDSWRVGRGCLHDDELNRLASARAATDQWRLMLPRDQKQTIGQICSTARRLKRQGKLGILIIDYLGLIEMQPGDRQQRYQQLGDITRRLKLLANELGVPIMLLCQLNRDGDKERPKLSMLRESGNIEQDADTVILLSTEYERNPDTTPPDVIDVCVDIAKQRNGPTEALTVQLHRATFKFHEKGNADRF